MPGLPLPLRERVGERGGPERHASVIIAFAILHSSSRCMLRERAAWHPSPKPSSARGREPVHRASLTVVCRSRAGEIFASASRRDCRRRPPPLPRKRGVCLQNFGILEKYP